MAHSQRAPLPSTDPLLHRVLKRPLTHTPHLPLPYPLQEALPD